MPLPPHLLALAPPYLTLAAPAGWHAALFACGPFPAKALEAQALGEFLDALLAELEQNQGWRRHVLLQVWKLGPGSGADVLNRNISHWSPSVGLGIWPDRDPPRAWTNDDVSDAAAAMFRHEEIPLCSHRLMALGVQGPTAAQASRAMRGFGTLIEMLSPASLSAIQTACREVFLPRIESRRFQMARFFLPVLDSATVAAARSAAELEDWLGGAEVYVRESPEDHGVLLVSRTPLLPPTHDPVLKGS